MYTFHFSDFSPIPDSVLWTLGDVQLSATYRSLDECCFAAYDANEMRHERYSGRNMVAR